MVSLNEERPVYIEFEWRTVEDRAASVREGHYVGKDVAHVIVTPPGGNLKVEFVAEEWLQRKQRDKFFPNYKAHYDAWISGQAAPEEGTAIRSWPVIGPSDVQRCLNANIRTVEDLATAPEDALNRLGMGARALQQKAQAFLQAANDKGRVAEEIVTLKRDNAALSGRLEEMTKEVARLSALIPETQKPPRRTRAQEQPDTLEQALG